MKFNERLLELRKLSGKSQKECADELGVSNSKYNKWENGVNSPDYETLCSLADFYHTSTDFLLGRTDIKSVDTNVQMICEYTGLSEKSILRLHLEKSEDKLPLDYGNLPKTISELTENDNIVWFSRYLFQIEWLVENGIQQHSTLHFNNEEEAKAYFSKKHEIKEELIKLGGDRFDIIEGGERIYFKVLQARSCMEGIVAELCKIDDMDSLSLDELSNLFVTIGDNDSEPVILTEEFAHILTNELTGQNGLLDGEYNGKA